MLARFRPMCFQDRRQEQRFLVFMGVKRWQADVFCTIIPGLLFWCFQAIRYFSVRMCTCALDTGVCENTRAQKDWLADFPCGESFTAQVAWYLSNLFQAHSLYWLKHELLEAGLIQLLQYSFAIAPLFFNRWYTATGRYYCILGVRVLQKLSNLLGVLTTLNMQETSFSTIHYGSNTMYGATVMLWYTLLMAVTFADTLPLVLLEWGSLASIVLLRSWGDLTPKLVAEVLLAQFLVGIAIPLPMLYALESSHRKEFLSLEAAHLDPVASAMQQAAVPALKPVKDASKASTEQELRAPLDATGRTAARTKPNHSSSSEGSVATRSPRSGSTQHAAAAAPSPASGASTLPAQSHSLRDGLLTRLSLGAASAAAARKRPSHTLYVPKTSLRLVSVKIHQPPGDLVANPAPLHAAVCDVLCSDLAEPTLLATRHVTIYGCLHLFLWVQDQPFAPVTNTPQPAGGPCALATQQQLESNILQAVQQLCCPAANTPGQSVVVSTYGQLCTGPPTPAARAPTTKPVQPASHLPPELAWSGIPSAAPSQPARMPASCWLANGRVTLPCLGDPQPQPQADELVVALLPGSLEECAVRRAGGAARVVLVEAASGHVLLDQVLPAGPQAASDHADAPSSLPPMCLRLSLAGLAPLPAGTSVHLVVLPDKDRTGHVLCSLQLIAAPAVVAGELQGLFSDMALDLFSGCTSPAPPSPTAPRSPPGKDVRWLQTQCEAYNEHMSGLVCDMLAFTAPAAPLTLPGGSPTNRHSGNMMADNGPFEVASGVHQYLVQEGMVASADFFLNCLEAAGSDMLALLAPGRCAAHSPIACTCIPASATASPLKSKDAAGAAQPGPAPALADIPAGCSTNLERAASSSAAASSSKRTGAGVAVVDGVEVTATCSGTRSIDDLSAAGSCALSKGGGKAASSGAPCRWRWTLMVLDLAAGALQLAVAVFRLVRAMEQQLYMAAVLLYFIVVLGLYAMALGPLWSVWQRNHAMALPLLLRLAASLPYVLGMLPGQDTSTPAARRLLQVLLTNTAMHVLYLRAPGKAEAVPLQ